VAHTGYLVRLHHHLLPMKIFLDLFTTDYGLVALAATVVSLALAIGMRLFILKKIRESNDADQ
jgi:hypothetical protein